MWDEILSPLCSTTCRGWHHGRGEDIDGGAPSFGRGGLKVNKFSQKTAPSVGIASYAARLSQQICLRQGWAWRRRVLPFACLGYLPKRFRSKLDRPALTSVHPEIVDFSS
jgi:hypothetical protein